VDYGRIRFQLEDISETTRVVLNALIEENRSDEMATMILGGYINNLESKARNIRELMK
jgi:hypothetical protein